MLERKRQWAAAGVVIVLSLLMSACAFVRGPARPAVTLVWPTNGAQLTLGQEVKVESLAIDDVGVERVELWVDNALVRADRTPTSGDAHSFGATQIWQPTAIGRRTITIKAYNRRGVASEPSTILVEVRPAASASPGLATPTATVTVLATPAPRPSATAIACMNNALFVADVTVPDETRVKPGVAFEKIWRMKNSGACAWGVGYSWVFESGDQLGAPTSLSVPPVAPNAQVDIKVTMRAPEVAGQYSGRWRMQAPNGQVFGQRATIVIVVPPAGLNIPVAPAALRAETTPPDAVTLIWSDRSDDELGVKIYSNDGATLLAALDIPNITSVTLERLPCNTEIGFIVKAYNAAGESSASPAARVTTLQCRPDLPVIHMLRAEPGKIRRGQKATLSWELGGAREARLFPAGESGVASPGSLEVEPTETTTYRLVATNEHGAVEMKVTIFVE
jgi:hypothetical protein